MSKKKRSLTIALIVLFAMVGCEKHDDAASHGHPHLPGHSHDEPEEHEHDADTASHDHDGDDDHHVEAASNETAEKSDDHDEHDEHGHDGESDHHDHDEDEVRQSGSHSHGNAKLAIALEGTTLFFELDSPVYNLTGFEYAPKTDEEKSVRNDVEQLLAQPDQLFSTNDEAECAAVKSDDDVKLDFGHEHDSEEDHHHDDQEESHRDALMEFRFECRSPGSLTSLSVNLFTKFPRIEELDVVYLDQTRQTSATLTPDNSRLTLTQ